MEKKWINFAELFGDAFLELLVEEHTVTITLNKNKLERIKNLLKKPLPEDDDIYVIDRCSGICGYIDSNYEKCLANLAKGRCKNCIAIARNKKEYESSKLHYQQTNKTYYPIHCYRLYKRKVRPDYLERIGKTAFFDEEEAIAKLEELQNK